MSCRWLVHVTRVKLRRHTSCSLLLHFFIYHQIREMKTTLKQNHSSLDFAFRAPEKKECPTRNEALESISTNTTHAETDKPWLIKSSSSEHQSSPSQDTKLDEKQPKQEHKPTMHGNDTADIPMDEPGTRIKQEELSKKASLPRTSDSGRVALVLTLLSHSD